MAFIPDLEKALRQMVAAIEHQPASIAQARTTLYAVIGRIEPLVLGQGTERAQKYAELGDALREICAAACRDEACGGANTLWKDALDRCEPYFQQYHLFAAQPVTFAASSSISITPGAKPHDQKPSSGNLPTL